MSPRPQPRRCAIYTRKSSEEGLEQAFNSLDAQREACEAFIRSQRQEGWHLVAASFDDGGVSGGTLDRPALQRLLVEIERGAIDTVVVYKVDRLTRALSDFARLVEIFDRHNVAFVSVTQQFNTTSSMGRLTLNVLLSFAQFEREVTSERIRDKFAASRAKGLWMGGTVPLGYDLKDRRLVVNEQEAATVQYIFQRYADVKCVRLLKTELDTSGICSKRRVSAAGTVSGGTPFSRGALYALLRNRLYRGEARAIPCRGREVGKQHLAFGWQGAVVLRARARQLRGGSAESIVRSCAEATICSGDAKGAPLSKTDMAKYLNAWNGAPHLVSFGNQKNFQLFMQALKEQHPDGFEPDAAWYKSLIAKSILFRSVQAIVRAAKFPAYQANIAAYTVAYLSWRTGGRIDFEEVWANQAISTELKELLKLWTAEIDIALRSTAGSRMPSEWAKKADCWEALRELSLDLPDPLPTELRAQLSATGAGRIGVRRRDDLTPEDLQRIENCWAIDAMTWFKVAQWGKKSKQIHWRVADIAKTVGEYAVGGWERSPSAKQSRWAMEAYLAAKRAGALAERANAVTAPAMPFNASGSEIRGPAGSVGFRSHELDSKVITVLVKENPKRGASPDRFALYRTGMRVAEYRAEVDALGSSHRGKGLLDVRWDLERAFIRLDD